MTRPKPVSASNPPDSKRKGPLDLPKPSKSANIYGINRPEPIEQVGKDMTVPRTVPTDSLERFKAEQKKTKKKKTEE